VSQTRERRIYLHWKAVKRRHDYRRGEPHTVYMKLARRWQTSIQEIKEVLEAQKGNGS
jgi:hypothetical protein